MTAPEVPDWSDLIKQAVAAAPPFPAETEVRLTTLIRCSTPVEPAAQVSDETPRAA